jgi:integrase/recombinase XerD
MSSGTRLTLPVTEWPGQDTTRLQIAVRPASPFTKKNPAANWTHERRRKIEEAYGQWLAWLSKTRPLDTALRPALRVTPERVEQYITYLSARVAPVTVALNICYLCAMIEALEPSTEWRWLRTIGYRLKNTAIPIRDKRQAVVPAKDLYDLGVKLMREAQSHHCKLAATTLFRDGLMIAVLAAVPLRLSNFAQIEIGMHLVHINDQYWLEFPAHETKTRHRALEVSVPSALASWLELYLSLYRKAMIERRRDKSKAPSRALWLTRDGLRLSKKAIRAQIESRTAKAFGRAIWPHAFRDSAATSIAIEAPEHAWVVADVLGHAARATADKYYNQANSLTAGRVYLHIIQTILQHAGKSGFEEADI